MPLFVNKVILAGSLTRDPQVRFFANKKAVADFGLAINRRYRGGDGEQKEETTFCDVECWGRTAELVGQYLTKGRNVYVEGSLKLDQWEDKDGNRRSKLKIAAQVVNFIDGGNRDGGQGQQQRPQNTAPDQPQEPPPVDIGDDEPPF